MDAERINKPLDERCEMDAQKGKAGTAPRARCLLAKNLLVSILLALLLSGCAAAHKPVAPKPFNQSGLWTCGSDSWIAVFAKGNSGKIICIPNTGVQTGAKCRDLQPPAPYCDGKNPCKCEPEANWRYNEYQQGCEPRQL